MAAVNAAIWRLEQDPLSSASDVLARIAPMILRLRQVESGLGLALVLVL